MTAILISVILGLIVNECSDVCPWCARKLVEWSARRRYTDPGRAGVRAEELAAVIEGRPGKLLKLFSALAFASSALLVAGRRELARRWARRVAHTDILWEAVVRCRPASMLAITMLDAATRYLPGPQREEYFEEVSSELTEIARAGGGRRRQITHAVRQGLRARRRVERQRIQAERLAGTGKARRRP
jgi:hypothetical protein